MQPVRARESPPTKRQPSDSWTVAVIASVGIGALAGALAGFIWGGVGGRIAMRVLFLTTGDKVGGLISDDGFEIGQFSFDTIFLLIFTTVLGGLGGAAVGALRMVAAGSPRTFTAGVTIAATLGVGSGLVTTEGVDFRFLEPTWLAIAMFLAIPGLWGVTVVHLTERLVASERTFGALPTRINQRRFGIVAWILLAALALDGTFDLIKDLQHFY